MPDPAAGRRAPTRLLVGAALAAAAAAAALLLLPPSPTRRASPPASLADARSPDAELRFLVLAADGRPVAGAELAIIWSVREEEQMGDQGRS